MTHPAEPEQSRPSTASGPFSSDTATQARTEERGAGRARDLSTRETFSADTSRAAATTPHAGTQTTPNPSASAATSSTKAPSGHSEPTSTPTAPVWPKSYAPEHAPKDRSSQRTSSPERNNSAQETKNSSQNTSATTAADSWSISPKVHQWMARHLPSDAQVLELGGGHASAALHELFPNAITVEHDERWTRMLRHQKVHTIHAPLERGWYSMTPELEQALATADVVVVDGPPGGLRKNGPRHLHRIKDGAWVLYDDSQRPDVRAGICHPVVTVITDQHRTTTITKSTSRA